MTLLTLAFAAHGLRATDIDGDGVHELVAWSDRRIEVVGEGVRELGPETAWWDAAHGLWTVDAHGLTRDGARVAEMPTVLAYVDGLGPEPGRIVVDLDRDQRAELLVWSQGSLVVLDAAGVELGRVGLPASGSVGSRAAMGGEVLGVTRETPPVAVEDVDGDGVREVVVLRETVVAWSRGGVDRWPMPELPDEHVMSVVLRDVDGDQRADLIVQSVVPAGNPLDTRTEVRVYRLGSEGFADAQVLSVDGGSVDVYPTDLDGDGVLELVCVRLDLDAAGLAQSLLDQRMPVELVAWSWEGQGFGSVQRLRRMRVPGEAAWSVFGDVDGDGDADLAVYDGEDIVVWAGPSFEREIVRESVSFRVNELLMSDFSGDGRASVVGWAYGSDQVAWIDVAP